MNRCYEKKTYNKWRYTNLEGLPVKYFSKEKYSAIKKNIAIQLVIECFTIGGLKLFFGLTIEVFKRLNEKIINKLRRILQTLLVIKK